MRRVPRVPAPPSLLRPALTYSRPIGSPVSLSPPPLSTPRALLVPRVTLPPSHTLPPHPFFPLLPLARPPRRLPLLPAAFPLVRVL